ncbi:TldD/PmbA family protein [Candidatus Synechococcus calcipolaris G9]|uniref:TldD/PmbA family protein n=1 Tax=Candidatus Synechococcus calcipolaris G9 TaxID=1497997 RepID=A0ABT6EXI7_9SYNE|nr:TldD/PmbA family protein [Candidatus Synechococcus calcipolaris]MDG2990519.1 TldD/PmbA family protein [Candidatus Synechococcus calcipolaris G9]
MGFDLTAALNYLDSPGDWLGLRYINERSTTRMARNGQPEMNQRSHSQGVMVEVLAQGQFGYAATHCLTPEGIQAAANRAYSQAIAAAPWQSHHFTATARRNPKGQYHTPLGRTLDALSPGEINDLLIQLCDRLKVSESIVQTRALIQTVETDSHWVSSAGGDIQQTLVQVMSDYGATSQDGDIVQHRSDHGLLARSYQGGLEFIHPENILHRAMEVGQQAVELLQAQECPTMATTLVLAPDQMMLQIHESIGHPLELDRILGDERNYAGSSFIKLEDFGKKIYGSPLLNVTFDPTIPQELASYGYDDAGLEAERTYLIQEGKLLRGLGSLESQLRSGVEGVANFRASSWNRPPIDRMANLNLEPGDRSFAEIISGIEQGVYMESNRSWSIDDYRLKFQFGCEYARRIENGQLTHPLRNPNYRGTTPTFWQNLIAVGDRQTMGIFGTPFCGKGEPNQAIRVGHASPVCAFADIHVFGSEGD